MKKIITVTLNPCIDKTITINNFAEGGLNRAESVRCDAGGKGINVAKVLKGFGAGVLALGVLGEQGSKTVLSELSHRQIAADFVLVPGETRTNYKLFDRKKEQITEVNEPGFSVSTADVDAVIKRLAAHLKEADVMVLAGSVPPGFSKQIYKDLACLGAENGVKVIVDADGESFSSALEAAPYAVKPNRFELEQLLGKPLLTEQALIDGGRTLLARGVSLVVISLGGDGALYLTKDRTLRVTLAPVHCLSTVGAGDSMVAAIAQSLAQGYDLAELAKMASAAGTATAQKPGSEVCTKEELIECFSKISVVEL